jgi:hypothetical protein
MGGVVSGIGNAIGGIGGIASGVAGAIPGIGPIAGPIVGGLTGGPLGFASSLASQAIQGNYGGGGGGGGTTSTTPMYAQPNINYGNNTYQYGTTPIDASKYFITGDRGVYNLLPAFGQVNAGNRANMYNPLGSNSLGRQGAYTSSEAYNDILAQMANDPKALSAFKAAYTPTAFSTQNKYGDISRFAPEGLKHGFEGYKPSFEGLKQGFEGFNRVRQMTPFDYANYYKTNPNPQQYVDYGLKANVPGQNALSYSQLAKYAVQNKNPFFLPYQTTQGATAMGFTPSASALAKDQAYYDYQNNLKKAVSSYYYPSKPVTPTPVTPGPITPGPITPGPVTPTPITPGPVTPTPITPGPITPGPVTPTPVTPTPVTPTPVRPGNFTAMNRGGLASLRRS